jgi:F-type H+-transporting ATPase subunit epsilon
MNTFVLKLQDAQHAQTIEDASAFVGEDRSGSFGILPGHARLMTTLTFGLARFRNTAGQWQYLALPGGLLYFRDNTLVVSTRHYLIDSDYTRITTAMRDQLAAEERALHDQKKSLRQMEEEVLKRMWRLGQVDA